MFRVNIDLGGLLDVLDMKDTVKKESEKAAQQLAAAIHGKVLELANQKLKSRRQMFVEGMQLKEVNSGLWVVSLDAKVRWIDDGTPERNMLDDLLASPKAKISKKDGSKYVVVPFKHGPGLGKTNSTPAQQDLIATIKKAFKAKGIPFGKIERHPDGKPKLGKLHRFDIPDAPKKTQNAPGQGKGPIGSVRQGPTGIPFLSGGAVYQHEYQDDQGSTKIRREIVTFRIASERHRNQGGRWDHPGNPPMNIMEDALKWAQEEWIQNIEPALRQFISAKI